MFQKKNKTKQQQQQTNKQQQTKQNINAFSHTHEVRLARQAKAADDKLNFPELRPFLRDFRETRVAKKAYGLDPESEFVSRILVHSTTVLYKCSIL